MKKLCSKCQTSKDIALFGLNITTIDGYQAWCKQCITDYARSKDGIASKIYSSQRKCSRARSHPYPSYSIDELRVWLLSQDVFHKLHDAWVDSGYSKALAPSCDRIKDELPYSFDNLQLMTWQDNFDKSFTTSGRLNAYDSSKKMVFQYSLQSELINSFESSIAAEKVTAVASSNIRLCCNKKLLSAGGFLWSFSNLEAPRLSKKQLSSIKNRQRKEIIQCSFDGEVLQSYKSPGDAFRKLGIPSRSISACCRGEVKHAGGYIWKFKDT